MSFAQALAYFFREASVNLLRSWRASSVAVLTIATSLLVGGFFVLVTGNLARVAESWRRQLEAVVYLRDGVGPERVEEIRERALEPEWALSARLVTTDEALQRLRRTFADVAEILESDGESSLPMSIEVALDPERVTADALEAWVRALQELPEIELVDGDLQWLDRLSAVLAVVRWVGVGTGLGLVIAAGFTTAFVIRLTAYLYIDEIAVMRLVGATEFFIRGPFYVEGLLQGLLGGALALMTLLVTQLMMAARLEGSVWLSLLFARFLPLAHQLALLAIGAGAGLVGAIVSLRRESLRPGGETLE